MDDIDYEDLDPGIRQTVRWFRAHGFSTTDSGDGVSKAEELADDEGCALNYPHVVIVVEPAELIAETDRTIACLKAIGIECDPFGVHVEGSYAGDIGCIMISYINDEKLAAATDRKPSTETKQQ